MKYSICSTVYNAEKRIKESLDSILQFINPDEFEIVVVDSKSTDGTPKILRDYAAKFPNFKIIEEKCTRGRGRQLAFENSQGKYIIPVDLDTIYTEKWWELIKAYENWEGKGKYALQAVYSGIYPRHLLEKVGGWRDLQFAEDFDLWWRLIEIDAFKWYPLVTGKNWEEKEPEKRQVKNLINVVYRKYLNERDRFIARPEYTIFSRLNEIKVWSKNKVIYYTFWTPIVIIAKLVAISKGARKREPERVIIHWFNNLTDFHISGEVKYNFIPFPVSQKIKIPPSLRGEEVSA